MIADFFLTDDRTGDCFLKRARRLQCRGQGSDARSIFTLSNQSTARGTCRSETACHFEQCLGGEGCTLGSHCQPGLHIRERDQRITA